MREEFPKKVEVYFLRIDPQVLTLFPQQFLEKEMERHGIRSVRNNEFLHLLRGQPMIFDPEERRILIAVDAPWDDVCERLNKENADGLNLTPEEAPYFVFFHECSHVDPTKDEWRCDKYAEKRILQMRKANKTKEKKGGETMHNIDPRIEELFTRSFLQTEMSTHGVKNVVVNRLISTLGGRPTAFIAKERKILVDPEYPVGQMRQKLNEQSGCADLDLSDDECWAFCFWHECARADDASRSESQCNAYARQRILEYRKER